jgi:predicted XRE-type DNA-binding protein
MPKTTNKPGHVTRGDVFDDLGFTAAEASVLKIKAKILSALLEKIKQQRLTQAQLARVLDDYQPNISILLNGKISKMSIEKLLYYAHRLRLHADIRMKPEAGPRKARVA